MEIKPWEYESKQTCTVRLKDVYESDVLNDPLPDWLELSGEFRPPRRGEWFISVSDCSEIKSAFDMDIDEPRLILRPKPKTKLVTFEVPEGEEVVAFVTEPSRQIESHEMWMASLDGSVTIGHDRQNFRARPLRRLEPKQ